MKKPPPKTAPRRTAKKSAKRAAPAAKKAPAAKSGTRKERNTRHAPAPPIFAEIRREAAAKTPSVDKERRAALKLAFLAGFRICASVKLAAEAAGISRDTHYGWLRADSVYRERFQTETRPAANQAIEDEIAERAMVGVYEPNVFQGRFVYPQEEIEIEPAERDRRGRIVKHARTEWRDIPGAAPLGIWRKSDQMLAFMARGAMPEKYGIRGAVEVTGAGGGPIEIVERLNAGRARVAAIASNRVVTMGGESDAR